MKSPFVTSAIAGLCFCATAWLISLLLADAFEDSFDLFAEQENVIIEIESALNESNSPHELVPELEAKYGVTLERDVYSYGDISDSAILQLNNNQIFTLIFNNIDYGFFSQREWLHLLFQCIAALATVLFTVYVCNNRLRLLDGAVRDIESLNHEILRKDPVERAVTALQGAKSQISSLHDAQKAVATDHRDLLASVAHEFRNPLARLQFANEMAMEKSGDEQKALFEEANQAAVELDELVRETLRYSRLSSLDKDLSLENVSIEDLFRDIASSASIEHERIQLQIQYPDADLHIEADKRLLSRALTNLISNALRYARHSVTLSVSTESESLLLTVRDDGEGIAQIHHDKLFEPFYRVERSRSRDTGGFGLGLSIVKSICARHNATVSVTSNDTGTQFTIRWPQYGDSVLN